MTPITNGTAKIDWRRVLIGFDTNLTLRTPRERRASGTDNLDDDFKLKSNLTGR